MKAFEDSKLYSRKTAGEITDTSIHHFRDLEACGKLPRIKVSPNCIRYTGEALNRVFCEEYVTDSAA